MYNFRSLQETSLEQITQCFNSAFSDYEQSICFTPESFKYYLTASNVDLSLSYGAFCGEQLVGIILNSSGIYNSQDVVFDAGTGVIPEFRGKKVFSALFDYTCQQLQQHNIGKYYLEVLQTNHSAVAIYTKKGFRIAREYSVLVATGGQNAGQVDVTLYADFAAFSTEYSVAPSYEHTTHTVNQNPQLFEVMSLQGRAYCIYAKRNGEIIQMHYNDLEGLKQVMSALTDRYPKAMAKNVDYAYADVLQMLQEIGFKEFLKQYEMVRDI